MFGVLVIGALVCVVIAGIIFYYYAYQPQKHEITRCDAKKDVQKKAPISINRL